ncbi:MAG: phosphatidylserine decarboxylase [Candidatus Hodarchaeota archaeon]
MIQNLLCSCLLSFFILIPLGLKWELDKKIIIPASIIIGLSTGILMNLIKDPWGFTTVAGLLLNAVLILVISIFLLLWRFFRDPERIPPNQPNIILSPADGKVIYIKSIVDGEIPFSQKKSKTFLLTEFIQEDSVFNQGVLIGITMNYLDVHVNRAPISGKISLLKHIKGVFLSLKNKEAILQNERVLIIVENENIKIGIVQIASRLVRKIVPFISEGQNVVSGERIGVIRFGSQVDLLIPKLEKFDIMISKGQCVKAGESIIASIN